MAQRRAGASRHRSTRRSRRKTIFFPPKNRKLAELISIGSPQAFRQSIRKVQRIGIGAREKRALVLAKNRAKAMLKKRSLSPKERREFETIARMPLPPVTKRPQRGARQRATASARRAA
jgi:hypothetical protein